MAAELAESWRLVAVNAADDEAAAEAFEVRALPTIVFFKGGEEAGRFAGVPNLILTPHIAGLTEESQQRVGEVTAENVRAVLVGAS